MPLTRVIGGRRLRAGGRPGQEWHEAAMAENLDRSHLPIPDRPYDGPVIDVAEAAEDADHQLTAEERVRVAMARQ
jgi:hypothetical protein